MGIYGPWQRANVARKLGRSADTVDTVVYSTDMYSGGTTNGCLVVRRGRRGGRRILHWAR
jgi:hypothetical protein